MIIEILLATVGLIGLYFVFVWHSQKYYEKLGVPTPPKTFPIGNSPLFNPDIILRRKNIIDVATNQYELMKGHKYYGAYFLNIHALVIMDPDLTKQILVKDFSSFVNRTSESTNKVFDGSTITDKIWKSQMANITGDDWKDLRTTFSPIFTSGKMKGMVRFIEAVNEQLMESIEKEVVAGNEFELKEKFGSFSMDSIASCAFGVDAQSFTNPNSEFVLNAKGVFKRNLEDMIKIFLVFLPGALALMKFLKIPIFKPKESKFFYDVIMETLKHRQTEKNRRNDLVDMMLDAMKEETPPDDDYLNNEEAADDQHKLKHKANKKNMDELTIVATALVMLIAGYDTTGQTMSYMAYELAKNPDIQAKLQDEIDQVIEENNGKLPDYNQTQNMEYLDMLFHETLRLYPAVGALQRGCVKDYTIPGTNIVIKAGEEIFINVSGMMKDSDYFPDPYTFNPDHFSKENKSKRHPYAYNPFGQGPRNCIGMRFAMLEAKMAIIRVLSQYTLVRSPKTVETVTLDPDSSLGAPKDGLWIKAERRN